MVINLKRSKTSLMFHATNCLYYYDLILIHVKFIYLL